MYGGIWISQFVVLIILHNGLMVDSQDFNCSFTEDFSVAKDVCSMDVVLEKNITDSSISVDWELHTSAECENISVLLCLGTSGTNQPVCLEKQNTTEGTCSFTGLTPVTKYIFYVDIEWSSYSCNHTFDVYTLPSPPQNVYVTPWYPNPPQTTLAVTWEHLGGFDFISVLVQDEYSRTCAMTRSPFRVRDDGNLTTYAAYFSNCIPENPYDIIVSVSAVVEDDVLISATSDNVTYTTEPLYPPEMLGANPGTIPWTQLNITWASQISRPDKFQVLCMREDDPNATVIVDVSGLARSAQCEGLDLGELYNVNITTYLDKYTVSSIGINTGYTSELLPPRITEIREGDDIWSELIVDWTSPMDDDPDGFQLVCVQPDTTPDDPGNYVINVGGDYDSAKCSGLYVNTAYDVIVTAIVGSNNASNRTAASTSEILSPRITEITEGDAIWSELVVGWTFPMNDDPDGFQLVCVQPGTTPDDPGNYVINVGGDYDSAKCSGLKVNTAYDVIVTAIVGSYNASSNRTAASTSRILPPSNIVVTRGDNPYRELTVNWSPMNPIPDNFRVVCNRRQQPPSYPGNDVILVSGSVTSAECGGLDMAAWYLVTVTSVVDGNNGTSEPVSAITDGPSLVVHPNYGPVSGGTNVTLTYPLGVHQALMDSVRFNLSTRCDVSFRNYSTTFCTTTEATEDQVGVGLAIQTISENQNIFFWPDTYTYLDDPDISSVNPLKTITQGGIAITVNGTDLNIIQQTIMEITMTVRSWISNGPDVEYDESSTLFSSDCDDPTDQQVICITPEININNTLLVPEDCCQQSPPSPPCVCVTFYLGFLMDNVEEFRNLTANEELNQYGLITVSAPPVFVENQMLKYDKNEQLDIRGEGFLGTPLEEYSVFLGTDGHTCPVSSLLDNLLTCTPPDKTRQTFSNVHVRIKVSIGTILQYDIGRLTYVSRFDVAVYVVVPVVIIAAIITAVCVTERRKQKQRPKDHDRLQSESDSDSNKSDNIVLPRVSELSDEFDQQIWDKEMTNRGWDSGISSRETDDRNIGQENGAFNPWMVSENVGNHWDNLNLRGNNGALKSDVVDSYLVTIGGEGRPADYINQRQNDKDFSGFAMDTQLRTDSRRYSDGHLSLEPDYPRGYDEDVTSGKDIQMRNNGYQKGGANRLVRSVYQGMADSFDN